MTILLGVATGSFTNLRMIFGLNPPPACADSSNMTPHPLTIKPEHVPAPPNGAMPMRLPNGSKLTPHGGEPFFPLKATSGVSLHPPPDCGLSSKTVPQPNCCRQSCSKPPSAVVP